MRVIINKNALEDLFKQSRPKEIDENRWIDFDEREENYVTLDELIANTTEATLPLPMKSLDFKIFMLDNRSRYGYTIGFEELSSLEKVGKKFSKEISKKGYSFFPTSKEISGYILDKNNETIYDIFNEDEGSLSISSGLHGSKVRKYNSFRELYLDIYELGNIASNLIRLIHEDYDPKNTLPPISVHLLPTPSNIPI